MHNKLHVPTHGRAPRFALLHALALGAALTAVACGTLLEPTAVPDERPQDVAPAVAPVSSVTPTPEAVASATTQAAAVAATVTPPVDPNAPATPPTPTPNPAVPAPINTPGPTPTGVSRVSGTVPTATTASGPSDRVVMPDATPAPTPSDRVVATDPTPAPPAILTPPEPPTPTPTPPPTAAPAPEPTPTPIPDVVELPSGEIALFYRTSFGSDTSLLTESYSISADGAASRLADITWDSSSKGVIRYIPALDRYDVMKAVRSTSYSKSSLYPITANGRLYIVRDWGSDWNGDNTRFDIEEMDPVTGETLATNTFHGEWFAITEDRIYFKSEVRYDLFGKVSGGGRLMAQDIGSFDTEELANTAEFFRAVENGLISFTSDEVRLHDAATGAPTVVGSMDSALVDGIWPYSQQVFTGDSAIYWAVQNAPMTADILSLGPDGDVYHVVGIEFDPGDVGIVVDEHDGLVLVGGIASSEGRGLAVTSAFVVDTTTGESEVIPINTFIASSNAQAGGGLQLLTLP